MTLDRLNRRFPQKRAFITGAASGLGLELCRQLSASGWNLGMLDVNAERLAAARQSLNSADSSILTFHADITDGDAVTKAVNRFVQAAGGLDLMINNAGVAVAGSVVDTPSDDWRWVLDINVRGCAHGCRAALPHLLAARAGAIVNVSSAAGFVSGPDMSAYNASKAAVISLTETLGQELAGTGVQTTVVMPSFFRTHLLDNVRAPAAVTETARALMERSRYTVQAAAADLLAAVAQEKFYVVLPRKYTRFWRFKRWFPLRFMRAFPAMRKKYLNRR